jgi:uncharacterized protein YydD (DUF2326 family)
MKIIRIYSNMEQFKPITFTEGFNVIYGDVVEKSSRLEGKPHEHNLGKTTLVKLIDFMLLKSVSKKSFFNRFSKKFTGWVFFMEIKLNNGKYVTIRRSVTQNTKISFKEHFAPNQNFTKESRWDFEDLALTTTKEENNPRKILNEYLDFDVLKDYSYRKSLDYFLRGQDDYKEIFKIDKYINSPHIDWKPMLFELLGYDPRQMYLKYELDTNKEITEKHVARLQDDFESEEVYRIRAAIEAKTRDRDDLKKKVDSFNFFEQDQGVNIHLVQNTETEIASLNKREYRLNYDIEQIQESLDSAKNVSVDFDEIKDIFQQASIYFPENLTNDYRAVVNFSENITSERNSYLLEELNTAQEEVRKVRKRLAELNQERAEALSLLGEKDTFIKYKAYQNELVRVESELAKFNAQLQNAETVDGYNESIEKTKEEIRQAAIEIKKQLDIGSDDRSEIARLFQAFFKSIMGYTALLVVETNKNGNVEFDTAVLDESDDLTGQGEGHTANKTLCASLIMAILAHYSNRSYFKFTYLDGVLDSGGNNPKESLLELARSVSKQYGIQIIFSVIKSDIPATFQFKQGEVRRTLSEDDRLFGMTF